MWPTLRKKTKDMHLMDSSKKKLTSSPPQLLGLRLKCPDRYVFKCKPRKYFKDSVCLWPQISNIEPSTSECRVSDTGNRGKINS